MSATPSHLWINGHVLPSAVARLSPFDHGWLVGDGAFETLVARAGVPFALRRHHERLVISCTALGIPPPSLETMLEAFHAVMRATGLSDARLRFTISSGEGPMGSEKGASAPTMTAMAVPIPNWPPCTAVLTVPWTRNESSALAGLKTTSYGENVRALLHAKANGAGEAILANTRGMLCEGTGSNVFVVLEGTLVTPSLATGCLPGVTRALVLEACHSCGLTVREDAIPLADFITADEAFITSSTRDIMPISHINGRPLAHVPGALTTRAAAALAELMAGDVDP
jgi:branched-chain amino acid aminotransferase